MTKKTDKHQLRWEPRDIDRAVVWAYDGRAADWIAERVNRTPSGVKGLLFLLRTHEETFVTVGMRRTPGETTKDHQARKELARDEVARRKKRIQGPKAASTDKPKAPLAIGGVPFAVSFLIDGNVVRTRNVDAATWARWFEGALVRRGG